MAEDVDAKRRKKEKKKPKQNCFVRGSTASLSVSSKRSVSLIDVEAMDEPKPEQNQN